MPVRIRKYRGKDDVFEVDIRFPWPDGSEFRGRYRAPVKTASQAQRWGEAKERELYAAGKPAPRPIVEPKKEVPTLAVFVPRYVAHARAERQKASTIDAKERIMNLHLVPVLGDKRLDQIGIEDVQRVKESLVSQTQKSVNNVLAVLSGALSLAEEWGIIATRPRIKRLKVAPHNAPFYDFDEYARLRDAAKRIGPQVHLTSLLGGDAGLRRGEMLALKWSDVDLKRGQLTVSASVWKDVEDTPKSGKKRHIPLTRALVAALAAHRHLRGPYVLCRDDGRRIPVGTIQDWMEQATRRAGLTSTRSLHILRHTFCSHLAMRGAPAKAIQDLAGHSTLTITMGYMHLSPGATDAAIRLLDQPVLGETLEKGAAAEA